MRTRLALILTTLVLTSCANLTPQQNEALTAAGGIILQAGVQRLAHEINPQK